MSNASLELTAEQKLERLGYQIERATPEGNLVQAVAIDGLTLYASGQVPFDGDILVSKGKVPSQVSVEQAVEAAALCAANVLRAVRRRLGSLEKIERVTELPVMSMQIPILPTRIW